MKFLRSWLFAFLLAATWTLSDSETQAAPPGLPARPKKAEKGQKKSAAIRAKADSESEKFFKSPIVCQLKIEIAEAELEKLRADNRNYVRCTMMEEGQTTYHSVAIKLKGAAGSFREFDDRPALTLNMDRFTQKQSFHGLDKFHLNNSVQDESYLNEFLCSELFRNAGQPAPRVSYARVTLNGRDVGLYVLKEGFDRAFLRRYFVDASGNLYDGGFLQDVDVDLEKDLGNGPDDRSDLQQLRDACSEADPAIRWKKLADILNVDKFIDFMALEMMTGHWDGYSLTKNNYRLYFNPRTKRAHFLAHGMDQMFGDPNASVLDFPGAIVASAVMQNPVWRKRYRVRLKELLPLFAPPEHLLEVTSAQEQRLLPVFAAMGEDQAHAFKERVAELKQRLTERAASLTMQIAQPDPGPLEFNEQGIAELGEWYGASESEGVTHEEIELPGARRSYSIQGAPQGGGVASWRRKVLLAKGKYQFQGEAKTNQVIAQEDEKGSGVGLRISGVNREGSLAGTSDWKPLTFDFEIHEDAREVELVAEIRATTGQVWFDAKSLRLKRLSDSN